MATDKKILYVDDEKHNLTAFRASFRQDYDVITAHSAAEAMTILDDEDINLVLTDQRMPEMTGIEFLEVVRVQYPDTIRMIITAYGDMQTVIDSVNKGKIYHFVSKPWNYDELKIIIENALKSQELELKNRRLTEEKRLLEVEAERREKEYVKSQLKRLQNQVNPHFLFNSLNSLHALIDEDAGLAKKFVLKLSKLYRYVLDFNDYELSTLEDELNVVEHYLFLQKIRFNDNIIFNNKVEEVYLHKKVPVNSLLVLVENCIKHNIISSTNNLEITIRSEKEFLVVENNFNPREETTESTKTGQKNLTERYKYVSVSSPSYFVDEGKYTAKIPII